jgi:hypothetical protein
MRRAQELATPHLHRDTDVDLARVEAFLNAGPEVRLKVLAVLRSQASDDSTANELAILALTFSIVGLMVTPAAADLGNTDGIARVIFGGLLGVAAILMVLPFAVPALVRTQRRQSAIVWLRAYEDALAAPVSRARPSSGVRLLIRRFLRLQEARP